MRRCTSREGARGNRSMVLWQGGFDGIAEFQKDDKRTWRTTASLARCTREEPTRFVTRHRHIPKANQLRREWTERSEPLDANADCSGSRYSVARSEYPAT